MTNEDNNQLVEQEQEDEPRHGGARIIGAPIGDLKNNNQHNNNKRENNTMKPTPVTSNNNAWREFRDCLNEDRWFIDTDGRRETLARIIVKHGLDAQYREFAPSCLL